MIVIYFVYFSQDQGRDIPQDAEPAASPRRLQLGQIATLPPQGLGRGRELPPMVLQPDFRKVNFNSYKLI